MQQLPHHRRYWNALRALYPERFQPMAAKTWEEFVDEHPWLKEELLPQFDYDIPPVTKEEESEMTLEDGNSPPRPNAKDQDQLLKFQITMATEADYQQAELDALKTMCDGWTDIQQQRVYAYLYSLGIRLDTALAKIRKADAAKK